MYTGEYINSQKSLISYLFLHSDHIHRALSAEFFVHIVPLFHCSSTYPPQWKTSWKIRVKNDERNEIEGFEISSICDGTSMIRILRRDHFGSRWVRKRFMSF